MSWAEGAGKRFGLGGPIRPAPFRVSFSRPNSIASDADRRNDYIVTNPLSGWNEGTAGSHVRTWSSGGIRFMLTVTETRFRRAPWGRKKHLLPLPILSIVFLVTAMAAPGLLHMTVTIVDDGNLKFTATVQNVVHPSGPTGKIVGIMTVTNKASMDIRITAASVRIQSLTDNTPDSRLDTTVTISVPLTVRAGATVTAPFSGPFSGNVLTLQTSDSFLVTPLVTWFSVTSSGSLLGPFTYDQVKTCSGPAPSAPYWMSASCTNA